jgi:hypothetical protein
VAGGPWDLADINAVENLLLQLTEARRVGSPRAMALQRGIRINREDRDMSK